MRRERSAAAPRRGVTMPFVCVMLTAMIGGLALAVDLGRMYYAAAEVQTAADAAALAAARAQQYDPQYGLSNVVSAAQTIASLNKGNGQAVQVQSQDVMAVTYDPSTRAIAATTYTQNTAAFTVTAQAQVPSVIAMGGRTVRRSATAWIANVNGANCVRPIGLNYTNFYEAGVTHDTRYSSTGTLAPDFNLWDIGSTHFANMPQRTFIVLPPWSKKSYWDAQRPDTGYSNGATGFVSHGTWEPVDFSQSGSVNGLYSIYYTLSAAEGSPMCTGYTTSVGDVKQPWVARPTPSGSDPSQSDSAYLIFATNQAMIQLCHQFGTAHNAFCYDGSGNVGVKTRMMLTDSLAANGVWTHKVREVGRVRIMCYFQSASDICNPQPMNEPPATVGTWTSWGPLKGYPAGTFMIMLDTPGSTDLTRDIVLSTKPGLTQRVLLAK